MRKPITVCFLAALLGGGLTAVAAANEPEKTQEEAKRSYDIPAQSLADALEEFGRQSGRAVMFNREKISGKTSSEVKGVHVAEEALQVLLKGTGVAARVVNENTYVIADSPFIAVASAQTQAEQKVESSGEEGRGEDGEQEVPESEEEDKETGLSSGIPEILVTGSKMGTLNADIKRTEDDIQPYVVLDREKIERSGAMSLDEFLKNQLAANVSSVSANQTEIRITGGINLRGLGADETLILIDGRRAAGFNDTGTPSQPNINGLPLSAIERIEVLPTSASGIYGGGATGGVINIVLRRDYRGLEATYTYDGTFEGGGARRRADLSAGFTLKEGRSNILIAGSHEDTEALLIGQRALAQRGRQHILRNDPDFFTRRILPPTGATTNIYTLSGSLVLDDGTPLNSPLTHVPAGYPGVAAAGDGGAAFVANAGAFNLDLAPTAQSGQAGYGLLSAETNSSLMLTGRREFTPDVQAFLELRGTSSRKRHPSNLAHVQARLLPDHPHNPFQQTIFISAPAIGLDQKTRMQAEDYRVVAGVIARLGAQWQAAFDVTWNRSRTSYDVARFLSPDVQGAIDSGAIDVMRDLTQFPAGLELAEFSNNTTSPSDFSLKDGALRLGGPLPWELPGGEVNLTLLLEHRDEKLSAVHNEFSGGAFSRLYPAREQSVSSLYAEARLPFVSAVNARSGLSLLELQLSGRADRYHVQGANPIDLNHPTPVDYVTNRHTTLDPTLGVRYQPLQDLTLRASYATGYLPPSMSQLAPEPTNPNDDFSFLGLQDPVSGEVLGVVSYTQGGNAELRPESSESWAAGVILTPRLLPGLRVSADWSRTRKQDAIGSFFGFDQASFERFLAAFPERISRASPDGPITAIDATLGNASRLEVEAIDVAVDYGIDTERTGSFELTVDATHLRSFKSQLIVGADIIESAHASTLLNSGLKWRGNAALNWSYGDGDLGWRTRYFDSYYLNVERTPVAAQGSAKVGSQIYHDLYGRYRFGTTGGLLAGLEIGAGINNLFDEEPPVDVMSFGGAGGMFYSTYGDPRLRSFYVSLRKAF